MKVLGMQFGGTKAEVMEVEIPETNAEKLQKKRTAMAKTINRSVMILRADLLSLLNALNEAEIQGHWNRESLHNVYSRVWSDPGVRSQWETRKIKTMTRDFFIKNADGEVNEEATKKLNKPWFYEFMSYALDSQAWGFSLIEMPYWNEEKETFEPFMNDGRTYDAVIDFPRDHVKPELGIIVEQPSDVEGDSYWQGKYSDQLIFIGKSHDFGILVDVAALVLIKNRTFANWGEFAEIFGQDLLVAYSSSQGDARLALEKSLKELGSSGRMIADPDTDEVKAVGTGRRDPQDIYKDLIELIDGQVAKRFFGQDVVTNNTGQVVGEVGENVANLYGEMDARWLQWIINNQLIPHLKNRGIDILGDGMFEWDNTEKLSILEKMEKDIGVTKMGMWLDQEYMERTYGVTGERVPPYFNRVQTAEGEEEVEGKEGEHKKKNGPNGEDVKKK